MLKLRSLLGFRAKASARHDKPKRSVLELIVAVLGWAFLAFIVIVVTIVALIVWGLSRPRVAPPANVDTDALRQMLNIDIPMTAVKWEIFHLPEEGFLPAPDSYTILMAEIELSDPSWSMPPSALMTRNQLMPEEAREWLSQPFKDLMRKAVKDEHALSAFKCGEFATSIKSSGRVVDGFICRSPGRVFFHLIVDGPPS